MPNQKTEEILANCRESLALAKEGLKIIRGRTVDRRMGLRMIASFAHNISFIMHNMKTIEAPVYEKWWSTKVPIMKSDPLIKYFHDLRTRTEKQDGGMDTMSSVIIKKNSWDNCPAMPPGAKGMFVGDRFGRSGFVMDLGNGREENIYFNLPEDFADCSLELMDGPKAHLGRAIKNPSAANVGELYIEFMEGLIEEAEELFLGIPRRPKGIHSTQLPNNIIPFRKRDPN